MLIKYQALIPHLKKTMKPIYIVSGTDLFLFNEATRTLKSAWREKGDMDEKSFDILSPSDWTRVPEEANSYSLFGELVLLDIRFNKKTIDATAKAVLEKYRQNSNPRCLILIQATEAPVKQWQSLSHHENVVVVQVTPLNNMGMLSWIKDQLTKRLIRCEAQVPQIIQHHTQGNMLAAAQVIEKIALMKDESTVTSVKDVEEIMIDQCDFQMYELGDACLSANSLKTLHLLRFAYHNRVEPTLVLWLLTQEIRQLIQLSYLLKQSMSISSACAQLKIWPKRVTSYEMCLKRLPKDTLYRLLQESKSLDERIKTSQDAQIWQSFEKLALDICLGSLGSGAK
ncbi:MAG: DNA polymerase III subunit delta [Legionellales bacterium]|nr:DNA polymerase III subunit delta [Legionellales bacterium]